MSTADALIKANPLLPAEDFNELRKKGFKHIEKMGSTVWTDYNNSDPGITILDAVSYAITDLGYRTGFEIKDLLAPQELGPETWEQVFYTAREILHNCALTINDYRMLIIDIEGVRNAWLEPSKDYEVPLWMNYNNFERNEKNDCSCEDEECTICYGKLQLDALTPAQFEENKEEAKTGIDTKTAELENLNQQLSDEIDALEAASEGDIPEEVLEEIDKLDHQISKNRSTIDQLTQDRSWIENAFFIPSKIVELEGLYNVMVEYEENVIDEDTREEVRQKVQERLYRHRNLGEDFLSINAIEYEDFGITASIALENDADLDIILAKVYFTIYKYFTPSIPFYTIDQMMEKGMSIDEIFEGPALRHGFIDSEELEATSLFRDIRLSDIINEITDIPGIKAITFLHLPFFGFDTHDFDSRYFNKWVNKLKGERKLARIRPELSSVLFCKEREFISYNAGTSTDRRPERMLKLFKDLKILERKYKLSGTPLDLPIPTGEYMNLEGYYPVTDTLPMCYGISERAGLPAAADEKRQTQALQLRGYLLFFEQLLADYLVQLNHLRDLFSFDPSVERTYFTKAITQVYNLKDLIIDHNDHGSDHWEEILNDFTNVIEHLIETPEEFSVRRNTFLNHMLARFGEDLSEYEKISRWLTPYKVEERLAQDKTKILADGEYYRISTQRGKGYNYAIQDYWNTANVSGTERRVSRLLGFRNAKRRSLVPEFICIEPVMETDGKKTTEIQKENKKGQPLNLIRFIDPDNKKTLLVSIEVAEGCCTDKLLEEILKYIDQKELFHFNDHLKQRARKSAGKIGKFSYELWDSTDEDYAITLAKSEQYSKSKERKKAFDRLQELIWEMNNNEGFHLIEHLLLRPKFDEVLDEIGEATPVVLLDTCLDICDLGKGLDEGTEIPKYRKKIRRVPAARCFDKMPWVLEYFRLDKATNHYDQSILFQEVIPHSEEMEPLKFRRYENLIARINYIQEYGSERINYKIVQEIDPDTNTIKYGFILNDKDDQKLAQSPYVFNKREEEGDAVENDIEEEIKCLMREFGYELDLYCKENPCDNNEDPYSFRATAVFPCWPTRFKNLTFRGLVERTIEKEAPAHMDIKVMWVGMSEMMRYEKVYCDWLAEMYETEIPSYEIVNPLIEVLNTLQPCGCESCEDDCNDTITNEVF